MASAQVQLMCRYLDSTGQLKGVMEVPDPYYGGAKGFELVRVLFQDTYLILDMVVRPAPGSLYAEADINGSQFCKQSPQHSVRCVLARVVADERLVGGRTVA